MSRLWLRNGAVLLAVGCMPAALGQDLSRRVNYSTVAVPVARALAELSAQAGTKLEGSGQTLNDFVVLRVKDQPLGEVMKRIASCLNAEWRQTSTGYRLERGLALEQKERAAEIASAAESLAHFATLRAKELEKQGTFDAARARSLALQIDDIQRRTSPNEFNAPNWQRISSIQNKLPPGRAAVRIALAMDPRVLAAIPADERTVFSTNPTRMQRPLPPKALACLDDFIKEQAIWAAEYKNIAEAQGNGPRYYFGPNEAVTQRPTTVLVVASKYGRMMQLQVKMYDQKGKTVCNASAALSEDWQNIQTEVAKIAQQSAAEPKIVYSPLTQKFAAAIRPTPRLDGKPSVVDDEIKAAVLKPETLDPLAFMASEAMLQTSVARGDSLVASVPDTMISAGYNFVGSNQTPSTFLASLKTSQMEFEEGQGWLTIKPWEPSRARSTRVDRHALGALLGTFAKNGALTLEDMAAYALNSRATHNEFLAGTLMTILGPAGGASPFGQLDLLRFYGTLSASQAQELAQPAGMSLRRLNPVQKAALEYLTYSNEYTVQYEPKPNNGGMTQEGMDMFWNGIYREPTESLPNGIPADGIAHMTSGTSDAVFLGAQKDNPWMNGRAMSASELAWQVFSQEHEDLFPWMAGSGQKVTLESFRTGTRRRVDFIFNLQETLVVRQGLQQDNVSGPAVSLDGLPAAFKKQFDQTLENTKKQYANVKPGQIAPVRNGSGNANIPPAP